MNSLDKVLNYPDISCKDGNETVVNFTNNFT